MDKNRKIINKFISESLSKNLSKELPPPPFSADELSAKVAESLVYLSFLPKAFYEKIYEELDETDNSIGYNELVDLISDEIKVAVSLYFNAGDRPNPEFPLNVFSNINFN